MPKKSPIAMVRIALNLCFILFCYTALSQGALVKVKERTGLVYSVFFHADYEYDVVIRLMDAKGRTLISDKVYSDGFDKPYNLRNLPQGKYKFQVKYSGEKIEHEVLIGEHEQEVLSKERVAKEKERAAKEGKKKEKAKEPVLIAESDVDVKIQVVDEEIEALGVFFYLDDTDEFEYFYWEPTQIKEQTYKLSKFEASTLRVEVVEDGKVLAKKQIAKN